MYDSVDASAIPSYAEVVAGYVNGRWPTASLLHNPITIDVNGSRPDAVVLDMEWGDAIPQQCPGWINQNTSGSIPVVYCSLSRVQEVLNACVNENFRIWTAHYNGVPHICDATCELPAGANGLVVATQFVDHGPNGENVDMSLCIAGWPNV